MQYSIGELIDKLTVVHLKIWHLEEEVQKAKDADRVDKPIEDILDQIVNLNTTRNTIVESINILLGNQDA